MIFIEKSFMWSFWFCIDIDGKWCYVLHDGNAYEEIHEPKNFLDSINYVDT